MSFIGGPQNQPWQISTTNTGYSGQVTGTIQVTPSNYGQTFTISPGAIQIILPHDIPEQWQIAYFAAAAIQGLRASGDKRESAEIAAQAYKDAIALINAMKQVREVTDALTREAPRQDMNTAGLAYAATSTITNNTP